MSTSHLNLPARPWTASDLRRLPAEQRDAILAAAAAAAEADYQTDRDLTAFDAFGKDDVHGDSSSAESR